MITVNFDHFTVVGGNYCKVRHFSKTFASLSQVAKFMYDNRTRSSDNQDRINSIYLSRFNKCSGLTMREMKILYRKYIALCERNINHGSL